MRRTTGSYRGKRAFDLMVVVAVAPPAAIVGLACALVIKLTSRGPVFFRQERVGLDGETFRVIKFRTMIDARDNPLFPAPDRITPAGRWIRRLSLDELPQLINVARGDMSVVGPRPTLAYQVARYDERQRRRLTVRPGLTGLAQVRGRNAITWRERIEHDLEYLRRQSIGYDLMILWWTSKAVVQGAGVEGHPVGDTLAAEPPGS
jgi:lipopolysaccharide/colanic/teichoic acid biosynthesis glycosyltransferase